MKHWRAIPLLALACLPVLATSRAEAAPRSPIQHIVYILQENHSFDNVLGLWCQQSGRCDGAVQGNVYGGATIPLSQATDLVPKVAHLVAGQVKAVDGGLMDGFSQLAGCTARADYACYSQFAPSQMPNVIDLASTYTVSDRTFQDDLVPSWGSHLEMVTGTLDQFVGDIPKRGQLGSLGPGWGCDSGDDTSWVDSSGVKQMVPSCVPKADGTGPYRPSPVANVPTIMDRLDAARLSWKLYTGPPTDAGSGWGWAICPTFAECIDGPQSQNRVDNSQVITDAQNGNLPAFSIVTPTSAQSQHNGYSMAAGDNWIGQVVSAIAHGPDWASTVIFISWDDCGCFYDHVAPPSGLGVRVPMIVVSPYVRFGYTDSNVASYASVLAFTERNFKLASLGNAKSHVYDYMNAFNFSQKPLRSTFHAVTTPIPAAEQAQIAAEPPDPNDPT